jgi:hypothetical protein
MFNLKIDEKAPAAVNVAVRAAFVATYEVLNSDEPTKLEQMRAAIAAQLNPKFSAVVNGRALNVWKTKDGQNIGNSVATITRDPTPAELAKEYEATLEMARRTLKRAQNAGEAAVGKATASSRTADGTYIPGEFARQVSWGYAIAEDLIAVRATALLGYIAEGHSVEEALGYEIEDIERQLLRNSNRPTSTNPFSNAVEIAKVESYTRWLEDLRRDARWIAAARAAMEVL